MVRAELIYVPKSGSTVHMRLELNDGATVGQALSQSNIHITYPETTGLAIGIYGKLVSNETKLKEGDRIELYRALILDPKDKRRKVAQVKLKTKHSNKKQD
jgi:putative ubiquitin-RnfH superfamily antitoxin RatB of RatAB toxin-antitoxin module